MSRRIDIWLILGFLVAFAVAIFLGQRSGWNREQLDLRASTLLDGPNGASGLARVLERTGMQVERQRRAYFDLGSGAVDSTTLMAFMRPAVSPTDQELFSIRRYVERGGSVLLVGDSEVTQCFGWAMPQASLTEVSTTADGVRLPPARTHVEPLPPDDDHLLPEAGTDACGSLDSSVAQVDLADAEGQPLAITVRTGRGGIVKLLAETEYTTNRQMKETDVGLFVIPWIRRGGVRTVVFDEYHQGFSQGGSLTGAALRWLIGTPGGWTVVQLAVAAMIGLVVLAVRFGRPTGAMRMRRRSELEHLDALAAGLRRSRGGNAVLHLLISGLRRRLRQPGAPFDPSADLARWLDSFDLAPMTPAAREALRELKRDIRSGGDGSRLLAAANAVEDMWNAMASRAQLSES